MDEKLQSEFDTSFTGADGIQVVLAGIGRAKREQRTISIDDIIVPEFKKNSRSLTLQGLTGVIEDMGVINPIHVMRGEDDDVFFLIEGTRRLYSAVRSHYNEIPAIIWDFEDKVAGKTNANLVGLMLNRSQKYSNSETWNMVQILESVNHLTPGTVEFLLQLNAGDCMKLKDIMLADSDFIEIQTKFLADELTIDGAYKKLTTLRKKEDRLSKDEARGAHASDEGELVKTGKERLSQDEVMDILDMPMDSESSFEELQAESGLAKVTTQDTGERAPVPKEVKTDTFRRDDFKCQCCGLGAPLHLSALVWHHIVPWSAGGGETVANGLTLCQSCHMVLHNYITGDVVMDKSRMTEEQIQIAIKIMRYGRIAIEAYKKMGVKNQQEVKKISEPVRHEFPNAHLDENAAIYQGA